MTGCVTAPLSQPTNPTVLLVLQSKTATTKADHSSGVLTIVFPEDDLHLTWFTDRPVRAAGTTSPTMLVKKWKALGFNDSPPNAAISFMDNASRSSSKPLIAVTSLTDPKLNKQLNTMEFTLKLIAQSALPNEMRDVAFFIDSAKGDSIRGDLAIKPLGNGWFSTTPTKH